MAKASLVWLPNLLNVVVPLSGTYESTLHAPDYFWQQPTDSG
jgi:hypothetical protein